MTAERGAELAAFISAQGWADAAQIPLPSDASARRYVRLRRGAESAIVMDAPPERGERLDRFLAVGRWLLAQGFSAPRILGADEARGFLLLEDLGEVLFARLLDDDPAQESPLYHLATDFLSALHDCPPPAFLSRGDGAWLGGLVRLLGDYYLPALGRDAAAAEGLAQMVAAQFDQLNDLPPVLSLRDFHAENLLYLPDRTGVQRAGILDFQDAFATHPAYDLVSLLQDARRDVTPQTEVDCLARYCLQKGLEQKRFQPIYALIGAQRALRILAIFAKLCILDGKPRYLRFAPRVWGNLARNLAHPALAGLHDAVHQSLPEPTAPNLQRIADLCGTARQP